MIRFTDPPIIKYYFGFNFISSVKQPKLRYAANHNVGLNILIVKVLKKYIGITSCGRIACFVVYTRTTLGLISFFYGILHLQLYNTYRASTDSLGSILSYNYKNRSAGYRITL